MRGRSILAVVAILLPASAIRAEPAQHAPQVGDSYEIRSEYKTATRSSDGSSGSSSGGNALVERVIAIRDAGLEVEFDLPNATKPEDRAREWTFPARVFKPTRGPLRLLNRAELETRVEAWLKAGDLTRAACGRWYFTWNAFQIECDPESIIKTLDAIDLRLTDLDDGALYRDPKAREAGPLKKIASRADGATFVAEVAIDPEAVRRERANTDVVVAEITGKPVALDDALRARSSEIISGTITVTFDADSTGQVRRRTRITKLEIKDADGQSETETRTETVERRRVSRPGT